MQQHPAVHKQLLELARVSKILGLRLLVAGAVSPLLPDETESRRMTASGQFGQRRWPTAVGRSRPVEHNDNLTLAAKANLGYYR
jgi:hypothetical protein